jgi:hypothetical protein
VGEGQRRTDVLQPSQSTRARIANRMKCMDGN